jgi:hypothetical protein
MVMGSEIGNLIESRPLNEPLPINIRKITSAYAASTNQFVLDT